MIGTMIFPKAAIIVLLVAVLSATVDQVLGRTSGSIVVNNSWRNTPFAIGLRNALSESGLQNWNKCKACSSLSSTAEAAGSDVDEEWHHLFVGTPLSRSDNDKGRCQQQRQQHHAARSASIRNPQEAREITLTAEPLLKRQKTFVTKNRIHRKNKLGWSRATKSNRQRETESELLLLNHKQNIDGDYDGARNNEDHAHAESNWVPCSARQVALQQGRFGMDKSRRLVPSSSTKSSQQSTTAAMESSSVAAKSRTSSATPRGGNAAATAAAAAVAMTRPLVFWENMVSGAVSRSIAQTVMHPANTMKTILQSSRGPNRPTLGDLFQPQMFRRLTRGAGANFILSIPHGAVNFAVLEFVRGRLNLAVESVPFLHDRKDSMGPGLDFLSSAISTICCSAVSTPQMMITDVSLTTCYVCGYTYGHGNIVVVSHADILSFLFLCLHRTSWLATTPASFLLLKDCIRIGEFAASTRDGGPASQERFLATPSRGLFFNS